MGVSHGVDEFEEGSDREEEVRRIKENIIKFGRSWGDWVPWIKLPKWIYSRRYAQTSEHGSQSLDPFLGFV